MRPVTQHSRKKYRASFALAAMSQQPGGGRIWRIKKTIHKHDKASAKNGAGRQANKPNADVLVKVTNTTSNATGRPIGAVFNGSLIASASRTLEHKLARLVVARKPAVPVTASKAKLLAGHLNVHQRPVA